MAKKVLKVAAQPASPEAQPTKPKLNIPPHFIVEIEGQYAVQNDDGKGKKLISYGPIKKRIPLNSMREDMTTYQPIRELNAYLKRELLGEIKRTIDPRAMRLSKWSAVVVGRYGMLNAFGPLTSKEAAPLMTQEELELYIRENNIPINTKKVTDFPTLRDLVIFYNNNILNITDQKQAEETFKKYYNQQVAKVTGEAAFSFLNSPEMEEALSTQTQEEIPQENLIVDETASDFSQSTPTTTLDSEEEL